ncbi:unnamed protein product, partial [Arabidopsis halleri]
DHIFFLIACIAEKLKIPHILFCTAIHLLYINNMYCLLFSPSHNLILSCNTISTN